VLVFAAVLGFFLWIGVAIVDLTESAEAEREPLYSMSHWNAPPAAAGRFNGLDSAGPGGLRDGLRKGGIMSA
jgi:hypothetical protein